MTDLDKAAETGPSRAEPGPARPSLPDRMVRYGTWIAVLTHIVLRDRRFQAAVITGAIGAYALGSVGKNNQARPLRRVTAWYKVQGQIHEPEVLRHMQGQVHELEGLRRGRRALKPGEGHTRG
jgi:hypothetical protein